jgi:hypothetical protein
MDAKPNNRLTFRTIAKDDPPPPITGVYGLAAANALIPRGMGGYSAIPPVFRNYPVMVTWQAQRDMGQVLAAWPRFCYFYQTNLVRHAPNLNICDLGNDAD